MSNKIIRENLLRNAIESITEEELLAITLKEDTSPVTVVTTCVSSLAATHFKYI